MANSFETAAVRISCALRDVTGMAGEELLASARYGGQVLAILGGTEDARGLVRGVLERIETMAPKRRKPALRYAGQAFNGFWGSEIGNSEG
ncbi:MAG: hypothetical protein ACKV2U_06455 [Bryobacteraceae bacterium]